MSGAVRLAEELHETNRLLRDYVKPPAPEPEGYRSDLLPVAGFAFLATFRAMRNALVDLPGSYYERTRQGVTIACKCRRAHEVPLYSFHECQCGRVYCVTHRSVKVLPLDA